jgi:hypothetical protein
MRRRFLARIVDRAQANAGGVRAAPEAFVALAIIAFAIACFGLQQFYDERLAVLEGKLATQQVLLADYRSELRVAPPEQAAALIERMTTLAAGMQAGVKDRDHRARDPRRLYADDIPVALVGNPAVDLDQRTVTFPVVTAGMLLAMDRPYEYQNWKLSCGGTQSYSALGDGAAREFSYSHLNCRIVGGR